MIVIINKYSDASPYIHTELYDFPDEAEGEKFSVDRVRAYEKNGFKYFDSDEDFAINADWEILEKVDGNVTYYVKVEARFD